MTNPLVSIITPCFNQGHYLHQSVESALQQTFHGIEIIIVNDGSVDDTATTAGELQSLYPDRVRLMEQDNRGLSAARQAGLEKAGGEYLVMLDADDMLFPNMVESCLEPLQKNRTLDGVAGWVKRTGEDGETPLDTLMPRLPLAWPDVMDYNRIGACNSVLLRRSSVVRAGGFHVQDCRACEDWDLWIRMTRLDMQFEELSKTVAVYRQHDKALSCDPGLMLEEKIRLLARYRVPPSSAPGDRWLSEEAVNRRVNSSVFHSLGLAIALNAHEQVESLLEKLRPGMMDDVHCLNQFVSGLNHVSELAGEINTYTAARIRDVLKSVERAQKNRFEETDFGWFTSELKRQLEHKGRRCSKLRRAARKILGKP
jgi:glycosyltransferase involved in cell wall biosynthesis